MRAGAKKKKTGSSVSEHKAAHSDSKTSRQLKHKHNDVGNMSGSTTNDRAIQIKAHSHRPLCVPKYSFYSKAGHFGWSSVSKDCLRVKARF